MPSTMAQKTGDRLRLLDSAIPGGVKEFLHDIDFDQKGLTGNADSKMRQLEDKVRAVVQPSLEDRIPLADFPADDPVKLGQLLVNERIEGTDLVTRRDTFDIRIFSLKPLDYTIWLGWADQVGMTPPANWWV